MISEAKPVCKLIPINTASDARRTIPAAKMRCTNERRFCKITEIARPRLKAAATNGRMVRKFIMSYELRVTSYELSEFIGLIGLIELIGFVEFVGFITFQ